MDKVELDGLPFSAESESDLFLAFGLGLFCFGGSWGGGHVEFGFIELAIVGRFAVVVL